LQIDWLTVAAQIVNFLVLVWLLQRFLYKPITNAMRRREERIEERLSEAKSARTEAEKEAEALRRKEAELEDSKAEILNAAREEADALRERLEAEIREEMEEKRAAWQAHLAEERDAFVTSLRRQAGKKVLEITERVLSDYADSDTAERVVATFAERLKALDAETREKMTKKRRGRGKPARLGAYRIGAGKLRQGPDHAGHPRDPVLRHRSRLPRGCRHGAGRAADHRRLHRRMVGDALSQAARDRTGRDHRCGHPRGRERGRQQGRNR
jgi:alternate F1F0 ATPase F0 subunit B